MTDSIWVFASSYDKARSKGKKRLEEKYPHVRIETRGISQWPGKKGMYRLYYKRMKR